MDSASECQPGMAVPFLVRDAVKAELVCQPESLSRRTRTITRAADFSRILASRQRSRSSFLRLNIAAGTTASPRLGLSVSRRLTGSAVQRNRVRRNLTELFRRQITTLPCFDMVVTLQSKCQTVAAARAATAELAQLLNELPHG